MADYKDCYDGAETLSGNRAYKKVFFKIIATEYWFRDPDFEEPPIPGQMVSCDIDFGDISDRSSIETMCYAAVQNLLKALNKDDE